MNVAVGSEKYYVLQCDDIYETKAYFIWVKNLHFMEFFSYSGKSIE